MIEPLCFPKKALDQHVVVLGKTGSGKSSKLRHIVEYLLREKKRVCIVDPKGDWWGLKASADGKGPGFPVIAFGDFKEAGASDVPINEYSGKHVADLITNGNRPCILGFRGWMPNALVKFWLDFAPGLFNAQSGELYLVIDEVHNFVPKGKIQDPQAGKCIHWTNRLMAEGRGLGLICLIASQRPQKVHNDTLTSCETLIAARVVHKADRDAISDWIDGCGDSDKGDEVLDHLAQCARNQAYVWSPEAGFGPRLVEFPMFSTFDSFAPPQLQKTVRKEGWSTVDLEDVKQRLAAVIEEAKANDPAELRREITRLKAELAQKPQVAPERVPMFTEKDLEVIESLGARADGLSGELSKQRAHFEVFAKRMEKDWTYVKMVFDSFEDDIAQIQILPKKPNVLIPARPMSLPDRSPVQARIANALLNGSQRKIMSVLAQRQGKTTNRNQVAIFAGYSSTSSHTDNLLSGLRTSGMIEGQGDLRPTAAGLEALGSYDPMPTGEKLRSFWVSQLPAAAGRMLTALFECYPGGLTRDELAEKVNLSASSSHIDNLISRLRTLELVTGKGTMMASKDFFE